MPINLQGPKSSFNVPWFMIDFRNFQILTSTIIPGDITDSKDVILTEQPIPGLGFSPVASGGGGNRKISFTIPVIKRNNTVGNSLQIQQFFNLRERAFGIKSIFLRQTQFAPNPKVLFSWGIGSVPLPYFVKKVDFVHKQGWVNALGNPQFSEVQVELWLDQNDPLFRAEELARKISAFAGEFISAFDTVSRQTSQESPY